MLASKARPYQAIAVLCLVSLFGIVRSQAQARTDPKEVAALNAIFGRWNLKASSSWNLTGDPCTGAAIDATSYDSRQFNPAVKCDCSYDNQTTCHITHLKIYAMDVTGRIPEELKNLTYLSNLNLAQNCLMGPFPAFIGNLTSMQYLTVGINALTGSIPKELGNLQKLRSLSFASNSFSGPLPSELGNLTNLEQLYMPSAGVSGEIPSSFSSLKKLRIMYVQHLSMDEVKLKMSLMDKSFWCLGGPLTIISLDKYLRSLGV